MNTQVHILKNETHLERLKVDGMVILEVVPHDDHMEVLRNCRLVSGSGRARWAEGC